MDIEYLEVTLYYDKIMFFIIGWIASWVIFCIHINNEVINFLLKSFFSIKKFLYQNLHAHVSDSKV